VTHGRIRDLLEADHARLSDLLETAGSGAAVDLGVYQRFRGGLLRHIGMEEKLLLPAVRKVRPGVEDPRVARQLKLDHAAFAALLVPTPTPQLIGKIRRLLALHNAIEEGPDGYYAECESIVGQDADELYARLKMAPPVALAAYRDGAKQVEAIERCLLAAGRE